MELDYYYTLESHSLAEYKEKGSKFIAHVFPMNDIEEFNAKLDQLKSEHYKARHFCYAYRLGLEGKAFRANDDGEPNGSAGLPILNQLKSFQLTNVGAIVIRYFGGTKLGVSGLIKAYKTSTQWGLEENARIEKYLVKQIQILFDYSQMGLLMSAVKKMGLNIIRKSFDENPSIAIEMRKSVFNEQLIALKAALLEISIEDYVLNEPKLEGYTFKELT